MSKIAVLADHIADKTRSVSRVAAWVLGALLLCTIMLIALEIFTRKFFGFSFKFVHEYAGYLLAFLSSWGLAHTLMERAHIRIDIAYQKTPSQVKRVMDVIAISMLTVASLLISYYAIPVFDRSFSNGALANTTMETPLWIPHLIWMCGYFWFSFVCMVLLLRTLMYFFVQPLSYHDQYISADFSDELSSRSQGS